MAKRDWMVKESDIQKDDDQLRVYLATLDKSSVVSGCAGSGKSVLALIKAQRIQKERGDNYRVIIYTKALCKYMSAGKQELGLNNEFTYLWDFQNRLGAPSADYIIVDEIQDFTKEEIEQFISCTNKNFFFFGDSAQSIYEKYKTTVKVEDIKDLLPSGQKPKYFELYRNYRLPRSVAKVVQYIGVDLDGYDEGTYKNDIPSIPKFIKYDNLNSSIKDISRMIKEKSLTDVAILLPDNDSVQCAGRILNEYECDYEIKYNLNNSSIDNLNFNTTNPKVLTYHSAKGLQFETVFLPNIKAIEENDADARKALYVAMTRTYSDLYVMYSGELPTLLNSIPKDLYKTSDIELVEDI